MQLETFLEEWNSDSPFVEVKTSGSTGVPKRMLVEKKRMLASARMTCDYLGLHPGDTALLCMPLDYIAGKMMVVRSIERQLKLTAVEPSLVPKVESTDGFDLVAMVPAQVYASIREPWLLRSRNIIIGGGAVSDDLRKMILEAGFAGRVLSSYGMTETLSHIALRDINEEWYEPLPGVSVSQTDEGCLVIDAPHICEETLVTNDIAEIADGRFRIRGRKDNVICSGGIKIQAEEVEALLGEYVKEPFYITKAHDAQFGEVVALVTTQSEEQFGDLREICRNHLPRYWQPKRIVHIDALPMTETGKIKRLRLNDFSLDRMTE